MWINNVDNLLITGKELSTSKVIHSCQHYDVDNFLICVNDLGGLSTNPQCLLLLDLFNLNKI